MSQIKKLIILNRQSQVFKSIASTLAMSKNTVNTHLFKQEKIVGDPENGLSADRLIGMEEPEVYHLFHPGNPTYKDNRYEDFKSQDK